MTTLAPTDACPARDSQLGLALSPSESVALGGFEVGAGIWLLDNGAFAFETGQLCVLTHRAFTVASPRPCARGGRVYASRGHVRTRPRVRKASMGRKDGPRYVMGAHV